MPKEARAILLASDAIVQKDMKGNSKRQRCPEASRRLAGRTSSGLAAPGNEPGREAGERVPREFTAGRARAARQLPFPKGQGQMKTVYQTKGHTQGKPAADIFAQKRTTAAGKPAAAAPPYHW